MRLRERMPALGAAAGAVPLDLELHVLRCGVETAVKAPGHDLKVLGPVVCAVPVSVVDLVAFWNRPVSGFPHEYVLWSPPACNGHVDVALLPTGADQGAAAALAPHKPLGRAVSPPSLIVAVAPPASLYGAAAAVD